MYDQCLDHDKNSLDRILKNYPCAGPCFWPTDNPRHREPGDPAAYWHYAGSFFWFNHASHYGHPLAEVIRNNRWGAEFHLGAMFPREQIHTFSILTPEQRGRFYAMPESEWDRVEADWRASRD